MSNARAKAEAAKAAKQKKILAVTSVIFLALVGFQLPKLMSHGGGSAASATDTAALPASPTTPAAPDGSSSLAPETVPTTGVSGLPDTDRVTITPGSGQLVSFGLFKSKDPFVQQVGANAGVATPTPVAAPPVVNTTATAPLVTVPTSTTSAPHTPPRRTAPNGGLTPVTTTPTLTTPAVLSPSTTPISTPATPTSTTPVRTTTTTPTTTTPAVAPTSVSISTNGECEVVAKNGTFPQQEDIFRVVSIAKDGKSAKIAVVGGAYDSGAANVTLTLGKKLTLVNTADGTRYVLLLQSKCDVQTTPVSGSTGVTTTAPTTTVAPPTTTSIVTTPIVTDSLDTTPVGG